MKTTSILLHLPGCPFDPSNLFPKRALASVAASLIEEGHSTQVWDFGTLTYAERVMSKTWRMAMQRVAAAPADSEISGAFSSLSALWTIRSLRRSVVERQEQYFVEIAKALVSVPNLDFVAFDLECREDLDAAAMVASLVRKTRPYVQLAVYGSYVDSCALAIMKRVKTFDCAFHGEVRATMADWAAKNAEPATWSSIPNLIIRGSNGVQATECAEKLTYRSYPVPDYSPEVYAAMQSQEKFRLFSIEGDRCRDFQSRTQLTTAHLHPAWEARQASDLVDEMEDLGALYSGGAFHLSALHGVPVSIIPFAREVLKRSSRGVFAWEGAVGVSDPGSYTMLSMAGCQVVALQVNSGSQRLLDNEYGSKATVSQIERELHASKAAGLMTMARLVYPSPEDDYHTTAETLRLLQRAACDAAIVEMPTITPGMQFDPTLHTFGLELTRQKHLLSVLRAKGSFPEPENRGKRGPWASRTLAASSSLRCYDTLRNELDTNGVATNVTAQLALAAQFCGYVGRESEFVNSLFDAYALGDLSFVADMMREFNHVSVSREDSVTLRPFAPLRNVVGN